MTMGKITPNKLEKVKGAPVRDESNSKSWRIFKQELSHEKFNPISHEEQKKLLREAQNGSEKARKELIERNLRYVYLVAKYFNNSFTKDHILTFSDLINEGVIGLNRAIDTADPENEANFLSYATHSIVSQILSSMKKHKIAIDAHIDENMFHTYIGNFDDETEFQSDEKGQELPKLKEEDLKGEEKNLGLKMLEFEGLEKEILDVIEEKLTPRESDILKLYYGLDGNSPISLEEIGKIFGLTKVRINQIRMRALEKLKDSSSLKEYLGGEPFSSVKSKLDEERKRKSNDSRN